MNNVWEKVIIIFLIKGSRIKIKATYLHVL